jgi:hypothetical protein
MSSAVTGRVFNIVVHFIPCLAQHLPHVDDFPAITFLPYALHTFFLPLHLGLAHTLADQYLTELLE